MTSVEICIHNQLKRVCYFCECEEVIHDLELRFHAARKVGLSYASINENGESKPLADWKIEAFDKEIEEEFQRLKGKKK